MNKALLSLLLLALALVAYTHAHRSSHGSHRHRSSSRKASVDSDSGRRSSSYDRSDSDSDSYDTDYRHGSSSESYGESFEQRKFHCRRRRHGFWLAHNHKHCTRIYYRCIYGRRRRYICPKGTVAYSPKHASRWYFHHFRRHPCRPRWSVPHCRRRHHNYYRNSYSKSQSYSREQQPYGYDNSNSYGTGYSNTGY